MWQQSTISLPRRVDYGGLVTFATAACVQTWVLFIDRHVLALQLKPSWLARVESAGAAALHTVLPLNFNPGDATGTQGIGV